MNVLAAESVAPSARSTTRLVVGVVIAGFCAFLRLYSTQPLLSLLREVFGASEAAVSLTISAATLAVALASVFLVYALGVVATLLTAQAISGTLAWRFFSRGHHEAETPDPATVGA